jgi:hypothetical protein
MNDDHGHKNVWILIWTKYIQLNEYLLISNSNSQDHHNYNHKLWQTMRWHEIKNMNMYMYMMSQITSTLCKSRYEFLDHQTAKRSNMRTQCKIEYYHVMVFQTHEQTWWPSYQKLRPGMYTMFHEELEHNRLMIV